MRDGVQAQNRPLEQTAERFTGKPGPGWARPARPVKSDGGERFTRLPIFKLGTRENSGSESNPLTIGHHDWYCHIPITE